VFVLSFSNGETQSDLLGQNEELYVQKQLPFLMLYLKIRDSALNSYIQ